MNESDLKQALAAQVDADRCNEVVNAAERVLYQSREANECGVTPYDVRSHYREEYLYDLEAVHDFRFHFEDLAAAWGIDPGVITIGVNQTLTYETLDDATWTDDGLPPPPLAERSLVDNYRTGRVRVTVSGVDLDLTETENGGYTATLAVSENCNVEVNTAVQFLAGLALRKQLQTGNFSG